MRLTRSLGERRLARRHHEWVAVVRAEVDHPTIADQSHVLGLAAERAEREAAADRLRKRHKVGMTPK